MPIDAKSRRKTMTVVKAVFVPSKLGIATRFDHATGTRARTVTRFVPLVANHYGRLSSTTTCPLPLSSLLTTVSFAPYVGSLSFLTTLFVS